MLRLSTKTSDPSAWAQVSRSTTKELFLIPSDPLGRIACKPYFVPLWDPDSSFEGEYFVLSRTILYQGNLRVAKDVVKLCIVGNEGRLSGSMECGVYTGVAGRGIIDETPIDIAVEAIWK